MLPCLKCGRKGSISFPGAPFSSIAFAMDAAVVYADVKFLGVSSDRSNMGSIQQPEHLQPCPRWHRVVLRVGWAGNLILVAAVIAMGIRVMNTKSHHPEKPIKAATSFPDAHHGIHRKGETTLEVFRSDLKQHLCEAASKENGSCSLCPMTWQLHKDKCYWFSTSIQSWGKSKKDCRAKKSQLVVVYDQEQKISSRHTSEEQLWCLNSDWDLF